MTRRGHVYTVDPGRPFLTALAEALLAGDLPWHGGAKPDALPDAMGLAGITVYLPTRRPARTLQNAFLAAAEGRALLLPRIRMIGADSEELELLAAAAEPGTDGDLPRAIGELERQLVLTTLVQHWAARQGTGGDLAPYGPTGARTPAQAARLARELARLIDALETGDVDPERLGNLVDEEHTEQWARTLEFLDIALKFWPAHLAENGLISPVARRRRLLEAEARRLEETPPSAPVIVAGVTAADAMDVVLIRAVLALPNGALVLPALDVALDDESWAAIGDHPEHPQFGLQRLLGALDLPRGDVQPLGATAASAGRAARWTLACEAMRPAGTTEVWHRFTETADTARMQEALSGLCAVEAETAQEEAETIALVLREALEQPHRTAMLVTPDRGLARRVAARMRAWGLNIDDKGGEPFAKTFPGTFLELVAAAAQRLEPVTLMTLLKHPLSRLGLAAEDLEAGRRTLELAAFRAPYFGDGLEGVEAALEEAETRARLPKALHRLGDSDWDAARLLVQHLQGALRPLVDALAAREPVPLHRLAGAHYAAARALAATSDQDDGSALRQGDAGEWAAQFFASLMDAKVPAPEIAGAEYPDFYRTLVTEKRIRPRGPGHPRIAICDPYEARLQQADLVILGALNEGTWPKAADPGPWLSRPMRQTLGLAAPEERIGWAAHDLAAQLGAPRVVLTRSAKIDGAPTVPSRWLLRLQALVRGLKLSLEPDRPWLAWARARNAVVDRQRLSAPEPRPPVAVRPRRLSVTEIERWIANPYAIFARHILELEPLDPLGVRPGAALRGQVVHAALGLLTHRYPDELPPDLAAALKVVAAEVLAEYTANPRVAAFWAPRLDRFADWFAETEGARRAGVTEVVAETAGKLVLKAPAGAFTLTARADRIDIGQQGGGGGLIISDYKSSQSLDDLKSRANAGRAPQLPLEAAIAAAGGFAHVAAAPVIGLRYISTAGGEPPGHEVVLDKAPAALAQKARDGLERLIAEFDRESTPYRALRRARFKYDYDAYTHLARAQEWLSDDGEED